MKSIKMSNRKIHIVLGLMSGTSMDGLDCSLIKTDGVKYLKIINEYSYPYKSNYKEKLIYLINNLPQGKKNQIDYTKKNENFITDEIIKIIKKFLSKTKYNIKKIDLIGFSGQTIIHNPKKNYSIQLGSAQEIYNKIKIPIVSDFRKKDLIYGGQGAPIGCFYHKFLLEKIDKKAAIINIGGVSNISLLYKKRLLGYDLGPGNSLIDDLTYFFYKKKYDADGKYAEKGKLIEKVLIKFKKDKYFKKKYPKSLDKNHFNKILFDLKLFKANDAINTASLLTVHSILIGLELIKSQIKDIILTGGGRNNIFIYNKLSQTLMKKNIKLSKIDQYGFNGDMIEAQMFGYLAVRSVKNLPISKPSVTGVKKIISGGVLYNNSFD